MSEQQQLPHGPQQRFLLSLGGAVDINVHIYLHFDHAQLGAKLRESTAELKSAVEANQPTTPT